MMPMLRTFSSMIGGGRETPVVPRPSSSEKQKNRGRLGSPSQSRVRSVRSLKQRPPAPRATAWGLYRRTPRNGEDGREHHPRRNDLVSRIESADAAPRIHKGKEMQL